MFKKLSILTLFCIASSIHSLPVPTVSPSESEEMYLVFTHLNIVPGTGDQIVKAIKQEQQILKDMKAGTVTLNQLQQSSKIKNLMKTLKITPNDINKALTSRKPLTPHMKRISQLLKDVGVTSDELNHVWVNHGLKTPLILASIHGEPTLVQAMVDNGITKSNAFHKDSMGWNALMYAVSRGNFHNANALVKAFPGLLTTKTHNMGNYKIKPNKKYDIMDFVNYYAHYTGQIEPEARKDFIAFAKKHLATHK